MTGAKVAIVAGSYSDLEVIKKAKKVLDELGVEHDVFIYSAHRTPEELVSLIREDAYSCYIAIAGLSAALPGVIAAHTTRPVIGVPVSGKLNLDSILSIVQMPPGVPVAAVGLDRGENAALLAASILSLSHPEIEKSLKEYRVRMKKKTLEANEKVRGEL
ncbi:5-(carboxyamino)imidazole ribonucleotide mutase [Thermoplasmatales archaeon ex4484_36]|nr:MAG: 5-(carboxyamino)imidazole ribonucleotide mutase [Thermoplasmatales archaeon ex4484_36]RLF70944.1 MAG: 5-(carboxyamino)imidazole ribonucleotide mutase [Thermoplasmata archaeon]HDD60825.1 5-(carboxyamino)imidazole ribonucleotide mutase [Euryarchaeota archaeon]RLF71001.1 MAG: 5-(carboxyamino)imidazole ribonucleotide mutase [Thermoplasmata archaeon]RLF73632.1 MAG: 5-(carboxyamino)imidazole ribonucleotide mutase [Thermoplasmata archaeon]